MKNIFKLIIFLILFQPKLVHSSENSARRSFSAKDAKELVLNFPVILALLCHEFGHAISNCIDDRYIDIHIGKDKESQDDTYLLKLPGITIHSFATMSFAEIKYNDKKPTWKNFIKVVNGPIFQLIALLILKKQLNKLDFFDFAKNRTFFTFIVTIYKFWNNFKINTNLLSTLLHFIPIQKDHDGYDVWYNLGVKEENLEKIITLLKSKSKLTYGLIRFTMLFGSFIYPILKKVIRPLMAKKSRVDAQLSLTI